jgi:hypothetical protein
MIENIEETDFLPVKVKLSKKCYSDKCKNKPKDMQFYLTEWTLIGGCSTKFGVYYCEDCILKHNKDLRIIKNGSSN